MKRSVSLLLTFLLLLCSLFQVHGTWFSSLGAKLKKPNFQWLFPFSLRSHNRLSPYQKASTTPVFYVCNKDGHAFLQDDVESGIPNQRSITYFGSSEDVLQYLNDIGQGNPNGYDFRIMTTSLESVLKKIAEKKQSKRIGRYSINTVHKIQPSSRQFERNQLIRLFSLNGSKIHFPLFTIPGIFIDRLSGERIKPFYMAYEDLEEDYEIATGKRLKFYNAKVAELGEVLCGAKDLTAGSLRQSTLLSGKNNSSSESFKSNKISVSIIPPRKEIELLSKYYRNEVGLKSEFQQTYLLVKK